MQELVVRKLGSMLAKDGLLVVGHAESALVPRKFFKPVDWSGAFAFRKQPSRPDIRQDGVSTAERANPHAASQSRRKKTGQSPDGKRITAGAGGTIARSVGLVEHIEHLANQGNLAEAARQCQLLVDNDIDVAQAYYICGVVCEAQGDDDYAGKMYQRALETDPQHYQALIHMAISEEEKGNLDNARELRQRARDIEGRK
jgi:chemotaxis protein methyltransferase WspC